MRTNSTGNLSIRGMLVRGQIRDVPYRFHNRLAVATPPSDEQTRKLPSLVCDGWVL